MCGREHTAKCSGAYGRRKYVQNYMYIHGKYTTEIKKACSPQDYASFSASSPICAEVTLYNAQHHHGSSFFNRAVCPWNNILEVVFATVPNASIAKSNVHEN